MGDEGEEPKQDNKIIAKLEKHSGLPAGLDWRFTGRIARNNTKTTTEKPEKITEAPKDLIDPVYGSANLEDKQVYFVISRASKEGAYSNIYIDSDVDFSLGDEEPTKSIYSRKPAKLKYEQAYFSSAKINMGEKSFVVFVYFY